jgi:hypothetical protein
MNRISDRPCVEQLEGRDSPSTTPLHTHLLPIPKMASAHALVRFVIAGQFTGLFTQTNPVGDMGASYTLHGDGSVRPFGPLTVSGSLRATGFIRNGHAGGTLTLTGAGGTLALHLVGPWQHGFQPLPERFHFALGEGTGSFQKFTGRGRAVLKLTFAPVAFGSVPSGNFTLRL